MLKITKIKLMILILLINILFTGCPDGEKTKPDRNSDRKRENIQAREDNEDKNRESFLLDVPIIPQKPELMSGCEVTSLAMVLQYAGINVDKMTLAKKMRKDKTPVVLDEKGNIKKWGNPNEGFVGDITGKNKGFAVYNIPMMELMDQYLHNRAVDLTGKPFESLIKSIDEKHPVIVWATIDFNPPEKYEAWEKNGTKIKAALNEHAVVLVGYDKNYCYINNPFNGVKNQKIKRQSFIRVWNIMGKMAISYK